MSSDDAMARPHEVGPLRPGQTVAGLDIFHLHGTLFLLAAHAPAARTFRGSAPRGNGSDYAQAAEDQAIVFVLEPLADQLADARYGVGADPRRSIGKTEYSSRHRPAAAVACIHRELRRAQARPIPPQAQRVVRPSLPEGERELVSERFQRVPA
jgi:hypothetical protein